MAAKMMVTEEREMALEVSGDRITELTPENTAVAVVRLIGQTIPASIKAALVVNMAAVEEVLLWLNTLTVTPQLIMAAQEGNLAEKAETRIVPVSPGPLLLMMYSSFIP